MLACLAISLAAGAGAAAAASLVPLRSGGGENRTARFDSSLVVPDILADCPVDVVRYPPEELSDQDVINAFTPILSLDQSAANETCLNQAMRLSGCLADGSLLVKAGCCSSGCAALLRRVQDIGCMGQVTRLVCIASKATTRGNLAAALAATAERCIGRPDPAPGVCEASARPQNQSQAAAGASGADGGAATPQLQPPTSAAVLLWPSVWPALVAAAFAAAI